VSPYRINFEIVQLDGDGTAGPFGTLLGGAERVGVRWLDFVPVDLVLSLAGASCCAEAL